MDRACSTNGGGSSTYRILVGKPDEKRPLRTARLVGLIILKWT
jgi:hypothetical protein